MEGSALRWVPISSFNSVAEKRSRATWSRSGRCLGVGLSGSRRAPPRPTRLRMISRLCAIGGGHRQPRRSPRQLQTTNVAVETIRPQMSSLRQPPKVLTGGTQIPNRGEPRPCHPRRLAPTRNSPAGASRGDRCQPVSPPGRAAHRGRLGQRLSMPKYRPVDPHFGQQMRAAAQIETEVPRTRGQKRPAKAPKTHRQTSRRAQSRSFPTILSASLLQLDAAVEGVGLASSHAK